jgi:hypothetical protein
MSAAAQEGTGPPARLSRAVEHEHDQTKGPGTVGQALVFLYGFFAVAASARSLYQLATRFDEAPFAILLSVTAAAVYIVAFTMLRRRDARAWRIAVACVSFELAGVLIVGTLSLVEPDWFPLPTVWSYYGIGYGFLPLLLPVVGLAWLLRPATRAAYAS